MSVCMPQLQYKALIKLSCLTCSLVGHQLQFDPLRCCIQKAAPYEICTVAVTVYSSKDTLATGTVKVCSCLNVQITLAALLMFTADEMVRFESTLGALVQECTLDFPSSFLLFFFFFLFYCATTVSCKKCVVWEALSQAFYSGGNIFCLSVQKVMFPCVTERVACANTRL